MVLGRHVPLWQRPGHLAAFQTCSLALQSEWHSSWQQRAALYFGQAKMLNNACLMIGVPYY